MRATASRGEGDPRRTVSAEIAFRSLRLGSAAKLLSLPRFLGLIFGSTCRVMLLDFESAVGAGNDSNEMYPYEMEAIFHSGPLLNVLLWASLLHELTVFL